MQKPEKDGFGEKKTSWSHKLLRVEWNQGNSM